MKLDIEALAREAGFHVYNGCVDGITADARRLARLIVERCAVECENYAIKSAFDGEPENDHEGAATYLADKLRQLLEDK